jgi:hypothetical protein
MQAEGKLLAFIQRHEVVLPETVVSAYHGFVAQAQAARANLDEADMPSLLRAYEVLELQLRAMMGTDPLSAHTMELMRSKRWLSEALAAAAERELPPELT